MSLLLPTRPIPLASGWLWLIGFAKFLGRLFARFVPSAAGLPLATRLVPRVTPSPATFACTLSRLPELEEHAGEVCFQISLFLKSSIYKLHAYRYIRCLMCVPLCAKHLHSRSTQFITLRRMSGEMSSDCQDPLFQMTNFAELQW
jgi:hypothetical protein